jgi:NADH-quinone oxidoreductase subunit L
VIAGAQVPHGAAHGDAHGGHGVVGTVEHGAEVLAHDAEALAHNVAHDPMEYVLMGFSVLVALSGIFLAYLTYYRKAIDPDFFARSFGGVPHRLVYNKYYVDEIYEATFVRGTLLLSRFLSTFDRVVIDGVVNGAGWVTRQISVLEGAFDRYVVDGIVNLVGAVSLGIGNRVRRLQTGHIYSYLYAIAIGVVVIMFARLL